MSTVSIGTPLNQLGITNAIGSNGLAAACGPSLPKMGIIVEAAAPKQLSMLGAAFPGAATGATTIMPPAPVMAPIPLVSAFTPPTPGKA